MAFFKSCEVYNFRSKMTNWLTNLLTYLLTYLLSYLLTPWNRVFFKKLTGSQLVKKFPAFYGTRKFINAFTRVHQQQEDTIKVLWMLFFCHSLKLLLPQDLKFKILPKCRDHLRLAVKIAGHCINMILMQLECAALPRDRVGL